jgi:hypothetical protein
MWIAPVGVDGAGDDGVATSISVSELAGATTTGINEVDVSLDSNSKPLR